MPDPDPLQQPLLDAIFAGAGVGLCLLDPRDRVLRANDAWLSAAGLARDAAVGQDFFALFPGAPAGHRGLHAQARAGATVAVAPALETVRGREAWYEGTLAPVPLAGGNGVLITKVEITGQRLAEEALRESGLRLDTFFGAALTSVIIVGLDDERIVAVNDEWVRRLGWQRDEVVGRTSAELGLYADLGDRERLFQLHRQGGILPPTEVRLRRKSGELVDFLIGGGPAPLDGKRCIIGVWHDVTELRRADRALRESEVRYRLLFEHSPLPKFLYDVETLRFLAVNEAAVREYGYSREEFLAMTVADIRPAEDVPLFEAALPGLHKLDRGLGIWRHQKRDGSVIFVDLNAQTFQLDGRDRRLVVARDVTREKQAEVALRASEEKFRQLAETIREVFWVSDQVHGLIYVSPAYETIWGRPAATVLADRTAWMKAVHPEDRERVQRAAGARDDEPYDEVYRIIRPDGTIRWIRDRAFPVRNQGAIERVVGIAEDVTELRHTETQLRQAQKMEAIGRLAGGVAHDFNNLLTVILSCAETLAADLEEGRPPELEEVQQIASAGERARDLTRQLLAFARRQVIQPIPLDLNAVVRASETLLRRLLGEDIALEVRRDPALWPTVCDPGQAEQVLMNLAVNARDAMPEGGVLTLETANVETDGTDAPVPPGAGEGAAPARGRWVRLTVSDTGQGMTPEVRAHLFEPFFTTKEQGKGTGLGLATVHGIVAQSGGLIEVDSAPGRGSTFRVWLPRASRSAAPLTLLPTHLPARGSESVLLVEDEAQVRRAAARALRNAGYQVLEAQDGTSALAAAAAHAGRLELVITDVVMPGMAVGELVEQLRARAPWLRVLYMSGYARDAIASRGVLDSGVQFLAKPFTGRSLLTRVRELLDSH